MLIEYGDHRIFCFADTHGMYRRLEVPSDADILVFAGDAAEGFCPCGLEDFLAWYAALPAGLRIFVPGNHDRVFDVDPAYAAGMVPDGVTVLEDSGVSYGGLSFHSVVARPYMAAGASIPPDLDFLVTHGPAYSYLDGGAGCKRLFMAVSAARPRYHVFGHVHEHGPARRSMLGGTTYLNVSYFEKLRAQR